MEVEEAALDAGERLRCAAQNGTLDEVEALLATGCDVNAANEVRRNGTGEDFNHEKVLTGLWTVFGDGAAPCMLGQRRRYCALPAGCWRGNSSGHQCE
jgi:hypothetical protein